MVIELTKTEQALCAILRASLFGNPASLPEEIDLPAVLHEAKCQAVAGLIARPELKSVYQQNLVNGLRILYGQNQLISLLEANQIPFVILKGTAAAVYYPEPLRRSMGDVDFLVPQDRFEEAADLMEKNGYLLPHPSSSENPRHLGYTKNGVKFELHHHFSQDDLDIEDVVVDGLNHRVWASFGHYRFPMLHRLSNGLVLLDHIRHHLKDGLGLRQVIDWMMYVNAELDDSFWETEFGSVAKVKGLDTLAKTVTRMCQIWLGLPATVTWCRNADEDLCWELLSNLFSSGNFGRKQGEGTAVETVSSLIRRQGFFRYLQAGGERNWTAYRRQPALKPFCWLYQLLRITSRGLKTGRGIRMTEDVRRSRERLELLKKLGVY